MGRDHSLFIHPHIYSTLILYIIPSSHHSITSSSFIYFPSFVIISLYTITDLSFGVVPGGNPALSPVLLVDVGSTTKDMIWSYQVAPFVGSLARLVQKLGKFESNSELLLPAGT